MRKIKEGKVLKTRFQELVGDIFDNFWKYKEEDIRRIREVLSQLEGLNSILDKYDVKRKSFSSLMELFDNATGKKN